MTLCPVCLRDPCVCVNKEGWAEAAREYAAHRPELKRLDLDDVGQPYWDDAEQPPPHPSPCTSQTKTNGHAKRIALTSAEFVAGFQSPDYLIDGVVQRGYLYALTARTNHGKTAIAMLLLHHVALSKPLHGHEVTGGAVLYLAGENPDNCRARYIAQCDYYGVNPSATNVYFVDGRIELHEKIPDLIREFVGVELALVVVDTAAAYFIGDDTNSVNQQAAYARLLRGLTTLSGKPTVLVNGHPIKNAARDNLLPIGGSGYLNEIDGNLTAWANDEKQVTLHWLGKFRGPEFEPLAFELVTVESPKVIDAKGRLMPSVVALPVSDERVTAGEDRQMSDENKILWALGNNPKASFTLLAQKGGFVIDGREQKAKVQRIVKRLLADKLVYNHRGGRYQLTEKGKKEIGIGEDDEI